LRFGVSESAGIVLLLTGLAVTWTSKHIVRLFKVREERAAGASLYLKSAALGMAVLGFLFVMRIIDIG